MENININSTESKSGIVKASEFGPGLHRPFDRRVIFCNSLIFATRAETYMAKTSAITKPVICSANKNSE